MTNLLDRLNRLTYAALAGLGSFSILMGAFMFQAIGYAPCAMCLWQRWPHAIAILLALTFVATRRAWLLPLGALSMAVSAGIGFYHTGVERGWWLGPSSCTGGGNNLGALSPDALLPGASPTESIVMCDEVVWDLFGLSMASYNVLFSIAFALIWLLAWDKRD
ncbi:disulfide bond formation protein B [Celeribacter sp.]|uniref:disulfide bond formation protein B n=1 Tax=Celeribacter sp. TaxID=1890673 RepID=UPI003A95623D